MMPPDSPEDGAVTTWVAAMEAAMYPVCRDVSDAMWILLTTGDGAPLDATDERRAAVYGDPAPALAISRWRADGWAAADPQLDRRVTLLQLRLQRRRLRERRDRRARVHNTLADDDDAEAGAGAGAGAGAEVMSLQSQSV